MDTSVNNHRDLDNGISSPPLKPVDDGRHSKTHNHSLNSISKHKGDSPSKVVVSNDKDRTKDSNHKSKEHNHHSDKKHRDEKKHSSSSSKHESDKKKDSEKHRDKNSSHHSKNSVSSSKHQKEEGKLKEKVNNHNSDSISKPKVDSSSKVSNSIDKDRNKESSSKPKENHSSDKKHKDEKKHSSSSSSSKHDHSDKKKSDSDRHDKDKKKGDEHKSTDEKKAKDEKHREKENRDKPKSEREHKSSDHKSSDHKSSSKPKSDAKPQTLPSSPVKIKLEAPSPIKVVVPKVKPEPTSDDDDVPLAARKVEVKHEEKRVKEKKRYAEDDDSEDKPLSIRINKAKKVKKEPTRKRKSENSDDEPVKKKPSKTKQVTPTSSPTKKRKKVEEEVKVWKWWEEEKLEDGVKWRFLQHKGPVFAAEYEPLPKDIKFYYDGKPLRLSAPAEEVATFYARMLEHDYTTKEAFNKNFFKDWQKMMTPEEKEKIRDLSKCNFKEMNAYFTRKSEERKAMSKEEKLDLKKKNEETQKEYGTCTIDGHDEKIGNFRIEPPGLFRGRGEHPKMGMLKRRILPENVIINCSKDSVVPKPPAGHKWKEVRHDNTVTWLACWTENVQGQTKYVMLNASSKLKGEKDWQKYETARKLKTKVGAIRDTYMQDWKAKEMKIRQRAVALYFIDKLALRAGNEKEEGESADTVGCCSLRVEHIKLHKIKDGKEFVVDFDFLGKDSIRYQNSVPVEKRVFKNLQLFMENKAPEDDLFDRLTTSILNKHLNELMEGLTAKCFRTFNASKTLQEQLDALTNPDDSIPAKILSYNRANRAVAILCNHQRAVPKTFGKSMENLHNKIQAKRDQVEETEREVKQLKKGRGGGAGVLDKKQKALERLRDQLVKLEVLATDKEENKEIALGTSKLNYLDPRISVAWCKKWDVPIEKVYNKTQRDKFRWAIEMAGPEFTF